MKVKLNPSGTHIHKGFLKVRFDLYPDVGDKTYSIHHIQVPVIPPEGYQGNVDIEGVPVEQTDYDNWIDGLPKIWHLNPCLCHFVKIESNTSLVALQEIASQVFLKSVVTRLDDLLSESDTTRVSAIMRSRTGGGKKLPPQANAPDIVLNVNSRFANLEIEV